VTGVYKQAMEGQRAKVKGQKKNEKQKEKDKKYLEELEKCQNRGFTTGFLFGKEKCEQKTDAGHENCGWEFCGQTTNLQMTRTNDTNNEERIITNSAERKGERLVAVKVHNQIFVGDKVELVVPCGENVAITVEKMYDENGGKITEAHGGQGKIIWLAVEKAVPERTLIRRKIQLQ